MPPEVCLALVGPPWQVEARPLARCWVSRVCAALKRAAARPLPRQAKGSSRGTRHRPALDHHHPGYSSRVVSVAVLALVLVVARLPVPAVDNLGSSEVRPDPPVRASS